MPGKKRTFSKIADEEWDFRGIRTESQPAATVYEYARNIPSVRKSLEAWFSKPAIQIMPYIDDLSGVRALCVEAVGVKSSASELLAHVFNFAKPENAGSVFTLQSRLAHIFSAQFGYHIGGAECAIAVQMWMFPKPWVKIKWSERNSAPARLDVPRRPAVIERKALSDDILLDAGNFRVLEVAVDVTAGHDEIAKAFLQIISPFHTPLPQRRRGEKGYLLKILSAYRLSKEYGDYSRIKNVLLSLVGTKKKDVVGNAAHPFYQDNESWDTGVERCAELIAAGDLQRVASVF